MDCIDEVREKASDKMTKYQQKMAEYYNKRVKLRRFDIRDLVLRKVTPATKTQSKESSVSHGRDHTGSSITTDKIAITWRP